MYGAEGQIDPVLPEIGLKGYVTNSCLLLVQQIYT